MAVPLWTAAEVMALTATKNQGAVLPRDKLLEAMEATMMGTMRGIRPLKQTNSDRPGEV